MVIQDTLITVKVVEEDLIPGNLAVTGSQALLVGVGEFGAGGDVGSHTGTVY